MLEPEWAFYDFRRIWPEAEERKQREAEARWAHLQWELDHAGRMMRMLLGGASNAALSPAALANAQATPAPEPEKVVVEPVYLGIAGYR